jgi:hypothetical protein
MSEKSTKPPETDFHKINQDEHAGKGGSYVIENGVRRLVERTQSPEEAQAATPGADA